MESTIQPSLRRELVITPSQCDFSGRLGVADTFDLFMDLASQHAETLGLGGAAMTARGLFWLTVRTRIRVYRQPNLMEPVTAITWPGKPGKIRCERYYTLSTGDGLVAEGKTEWAVMHQNTGRLVGVADIYPEGLVLLEETVCPEPFVRMDENCENDPELGRILVKSGDIDFGGHMNNAAYVHALLSLFSTKERQAMGIQQMELCYRASCYEGEELAVHARTLDDGMQLTVLRPDGKPAVLALMSCNPQA